MGTTSTLDLTRGAALEAIARGWHVLACKPNGKDPFFPLAPRAYLSATNDEATVNGWWDKHPNINYGVAASTSGLIVLDVDYRNLDDKGDSIVARLAEFPTHTVTTGDGFHLYYLATNLPQQVPGKVANGIDVKYRGYVVASGSIHPNGDCYHTSDDRDPAELPAWVFKGKK
jgi:hypothetical protein